MEYDPNIQPWDKQPGEPHRGWLFFRIYRDMHFNRSYRKLAKMVYHCTRNVARYGAEWEWVRRANLYDLYCYEQAKDRIAKAVEHQKEEEEGLKIRVAKAVRDATDNLIGEMSNYLASGGETDLMKKLTVVRTIAKTISELNKLVGYAPPPLPETENHIADDMTATLEFMMKSDMSKVSESMANPVPDADDTNWDDGEPYWQYIRALGVKVNDIPRAAFDNNFPKCYCPDGEEDDDDEDDDDYDDEPDYNEEEGDRYQFDTLKAQTPKEFQ